MQRERGGRDNFNSFSSPFDGFGGMMSSIFGGRDPFDDPFFTRPFPKLSQSSMLHPTTPADDLQQFANSNGPVIQEINMDDEGEVELESAEEDGVNGSEEERDRDYANRNPLVEHPEDQTDDHSKSKSVSKDVTRRMEDMNLEGTESKPQSASYRRVTYGGIEGAYYTATTTRKTGSNGRVLEESKQADRTTGQATHRISRGIHDKGHSLTRKLASDGKVDTTQTLHNLAEDELAGFKQTWNGNADKHIPGWESGSDLHANAGTSNNWLTNWDPGFRDPFSGLRRNSSTQPASQSDKPRNIVRINIE
ncbi:PREDICTED: uncharacterized protein LOC109230855 isoform X1 [Nicotiana attenuata]|uniref:Myeloid leukemia factor 1 n=2 Tax=Nicotiana attenuata TaxID=49451 RepID=A0A1J6I283_NICAT|nr:PREDICTED: uncharacterized protein LOC109221659 isoform X1 [Nicotiana attenuata]XP_019251856.1 PREDICTED: uncharacterized protein LOC109230855 isoform X1 [Nicotiana attenuata]OIS99172.1 hypothetical protein A4A49_62671 [Nicotiana attenuata]OIT19262.1 hypothetical protein A4A49_41806 [Nicotiana attenuata]